MMPVVQPTPRKPLSHRQFHAVLTEHSQELLFDKTHQPMAQGLDLPAKLYRDGYVVFDNIETAYDAYIKLEDCASAARSSIELGCLFDRIQLAKVDEIPVCRDVVETTFQPLHFDMGHPFLLSKHQPICPLVGLYCPYGSHPTAKTRVVNVGHLLAQRDWDNAVRERVLSYVSKYGDGWENPTPVNTGRLACFARVLDAATGLGEFKSHIDKTMGEWFQEGKPVDYRVGLDNERAFYQKCGLDLEQVEHEIALCPGELLVVDNARTIHGRIGKRQPKEIVQFLYGVQEATPEEIVFVRDSLLNAFTQNHYCQDSREAVASVL